MSVTFPNVFALEERRTGNRIRQLAEPGVPLDGAFVTVKRGRTEHRMFRYPAADVLVISKKGHVPQADHRVVYASEGEDLKRGVWLKHPLLRQAATFDHDSEIKAVLKSWENAFTYVEEDKTRGIAGLRRPQIGAIHAAHAHWASSEEAATIVMPTGTGKTDTMIGILVSTPCARVAVVVPTDALRTQLAEKFMTLGALRNPGSSVLAPTARYPIVAMLDHIPRTVAEVDDVFGRAHVIVMTSSIAGQAEPEVQERMAHHCPYLFIDEAHHTEAPTWSAFKSRFRHRRVLQFTATPFREDGKLLDGKIIFKYSLRQAQAAGYFEPIEFAPVSEYVAAKADEAIAARAVECLRAGFDKGQILMARVESIKRANEVFRIYERYSEFNPVELHTGITSKKAREEARQKILSGRSRIVVCVDMLGEGFDLPELKIAAFHDIRKSLAVTLQLAGRFVRAGLGNATFVANEADVQVQDELRSLYAHDPDWNALLPRMSEQLISSQISMQQFLQGFTAFPDEVPLKSVRPATSAVVYQTKCKVWTPENFARGIPNAHLCDQIRFSVNEQEHTLVGIAVRRVALPWADVVTLFNWEWELYVVYWWEERHLLFINSSANAGEYHKLARSVAGPDVELIRGDTVFRAFDDVNLLLLQNVGLTEALRRSVRYTGRMGSNVKDALTDALLRGTWKTVLAGNGYEAGAKTSVGASRKGRIWSHRRKPVDGLIEWCRHIGDKLLDNDINLDDVLGGTLGAVSIWARPVKMPLYVDWPEEIYKSSEAEWTIFVSGREWPFIDLSLVLVEPDLDQPVRMRIQFGSDSVELIHELFRDENGPNYRLIVLGDRDVRIRRGRNSEPVPLADFFDETPPVIWFADGSLLEGNQYVQLNEQRMPYDRQKIVAWNWARTVLKKESQGKKRDPQSIQAKVIRDLTETRRYRVIFDDDGSGELADVVAVQIIDQDELRPKIEVELYHCKYSGGKTAGRRVKDLYEVCGQAQKCISWMGSRKRQTEIFTHLLAREAARTGPLIERLRARGKSQAEAEADERVQRLSRVNVGTPEDLRTLESMSLLCPVVLKIFIVQPGLSKAGATRDQLELLSVTENHLMETYQLPFGVIASA